MREVNRQAKVGEWIRVTSKQTIKALKESIFKVIELREWENEPTMIIETAGMGKYELIGADFLVLEYCDEKDIEIAKQNEISKLEMEKCKDFLKLLQSEVKILKDPKLADKVTVKFESERDTIEELKTEIRQLQREVNVLRNQKICKLDCREEKKELEKLKVQYDIISNQNKELRAAAAEMNENMIRIYKG